MSFFRGGRLRRLVPGVAALALIAGLFFVARQPSASAGDLAKTAAQYKFTDMPIAMPPGYHPTQTIRTVNPAYKNIQAWISSVGAGIAMTDVTGHGRDDGMCIVDTADQRRGRDLHAHRPGGGQVHPVRPERGAAADELHHDGPDGLRAR